MARQSGPTDRDRKGRTKPAAVLAVVVVLSAVPAWAADNGNQTAPNRAPTVSKAKTGAVAGMATRSTAVTSTASAQATSQGGVANASGGNANVVVNVRGGHRHGSSLYRRTAQKAVDPRGTITSGAGDAAIPRGTAVGASGVSDPNGTTL